jgi:hypothetical protein
MQAKTSERPTPPLPKQQRSPPGHTQSLDLTPDHGEHSYNGSGRLAGKCAIVTGADFGIGRAVDHRVRTRRCRCVDRLPR